MSVFYEGDVQSGIALALNEGKAVVCFLRDQGGESEAWESEWLVKQQFHLSKHAVSLRIIAGSPEATQLAAFYPISQVPIILIIRAGKLVDQILPGTPESEFSRRLSEAVASRQGGSEMSTTSTASATAATSSTAQTLSSRNVFAQPDDSFTLSASAVEPESSSLTTRPSTPSHHPSGDRAETRLRPQQESYLQQQARKKAEAMQERERVRALIEADKRERKARETQRRIQARGELLSEPENKHRMPRSSNPTKTLHSDTATLQVRLFDGRTMRKQFKATDTLSQAVREWIRRDRSDGDSPFTFKLILTPYPSRAVSDADERQSLRDIEMTPSASLALMPVRNFTQAYSAGGSRGFIRGAPMLIFGYLAAFFAMIWSMVKRIGEATGQEKALAEGQHLPEKEKDVASAKDEASSSANRSEPETPKIRIRTLKDRQPWGEDQQFYNGNQLSFEPNNKHDREDDDDDDEDKKGG